jgi:hypothetical protein
MMFSRIRRLAWFIQVLVLIIVAMVVVMVAGSDTTNQQVVGVVGEGEEQGESSRTSTRTEDANTDTENNVCRPPEGVSTSSSDQETISYVLLAVSGTLEEGFELRPNMDYRPNHNNNDNNNVGRVNATFLGKALVRGYKSFLDIKNPTWR